MQQLLIVGSMISREIWLRAFIIKVMLMKSVLQIQTVQGALTSSHIIPSLFLYTRLSSHFARKNSPTSFNVFSLFVSFPSSFQHIPKWFFTSPTAVNAMWKTRFIMPCLFWASATLPRSTTIFIKSRSLNAVLYRSLTSIISRNWRASSTTW